MRLTVAVALFALSSMCLAADPAKASIRKTTSIPAESLGTALQALASTYNFQILYRTETVKDLKTRGATGTFTPQEALGAVLAGTGLAYKYVDEKTVTIIPTAAATPAQSSAPLADSHKEAGKTSSRDFLVAQVDQGQISGKSSVAGPDQSPKQLDQQKDQLQEVVVTGTLLHDVAPITPVMTITHDDIINQGYATLADVIFDLPQNFQGAGTSPGSNPVSGAGGSNASLNSTYASGVNLRGLGGGATLVLLNGRRLAPTAYGVAVDITQIPVSVIDRVEVLTDGASALYGSDAVAGVVNIITKNDFSGVEVGARATGMASGKAPNYGGDIVGGTSWERGGVVSSFDYEKDNPLFADDRSFSDGLPSPWNLAPKQEALHFYASIHQEIADKFTFTADTLLSHRTFDVSAGEAGLPVPYVTTGHANQYSFSPEVDYKITSSWTASLIGQWSRDQDLTGLYDPYFGYTAANPITYQVAYLEPRVDGKLWSLPGGPLSLAFGAQMRQEKFDYSQSLAYVGVPPSLSSADLSRHVTSAYAELMIPLVGVDSAVPLVRELRVDVSGRYDHYSDFGKTTNPKVGIGWTPIESVQLHGSYAKSFQAPTLNDLSTVGQAASVSPYIDPQAASGSSLGIYTFYNAPNLKPETADSYNLGLTIEPSIATDLKIDASYFSIDFKNQIVNIFGEGFCPTLDCTVQEQAQLGSNLQRNPSPSEVNAILNNPNIYVGNYAAGNFSPAPYTPADITAIFTLGTANAAVTHVSGIDFSPRYVGPDTRIGKFTADLSASYYLKYEQQVTAGAPSRSIDNTLDNPLRFRAKANFGWQFRGLAGNVRVNYANSYINPSNTSCSGGCPISSWTTVDLALSYTVPEDVAWLRNTRFAINISNVFDRNPPMVTYPGYLYGYDPVNANPLLREVAITFTKKWTP
jgi:iron complex outermembrane receptor protein